MSDDFDRTTRRTDPDEGGQLTSEDPLAGGDVAYEETGYQTGSSTNDPYEAPVSSGGGFPATDTEYGTTASGTSTIGSTWSDDTEYASGSTSSSTSTKDVAKEQGQQVGQEAVAGGQHVAGVAADQAKNVVSEAGTQAKNLLGEARTQLSSQASTQQNNLAAWLRDLAGELGSMADRSDAAETPSGTATNLAQQASGRAHSVASWLEDHEPADAFDRVSKFARQRPGMFLALAAVGGLLAGRLTRGLTSDSSSSDSTPGTLSASTSSPAMDPRLGYADTSSSRQAYAAPSLTEPTTSTVTSAGDEPWPFDEGMRGGAGTSKDDDFGLPDERGADQINSGYADGADGPSDQGRR